MYTHPCIKCGTQYQSEDVDAYYCADCDKARKSLAAEIDAKVGSTVGQKPNDMFADAQDYRGIKLFKM